MEINNTSTRSNNNRSLKSTTAATSVFHVGISSSNANYDDWWSCTCISTTTTYSGNPSNCTCRSNSGLENCGRSDTKWIENLNWNWAISVTRTTTSYGDTFNCTCTINSCSCCSGQDCLVSSSETNLIFINNTTSRKTVSVITSEEDRCTNSRIGSFCHHKVNFRSLEDVVNQDHTLIYNLWTIFRSNNTSYVRIIL